VLFTDRNMQVEALVMRITLNYISEKEITTFVHSYRWIMA